MSRGMYGTLDLADDLLPCPMCGSAAGYLYPNRNPKDLQIRCSNTSSCDIRTPPNFQSRDDVRAVWNRRAHVQGGIGGGPYSYSADAELIRHVALCWHGKAVDECGLCR